MLIIDAKRDERFITEPIRSRRLPAPPEGYYIFISQGRAVIVGAPVLRTSLTRERSFCFRLHCSSAFKGRRHWLLSRNGSRETDAVLLQRTLSDCQTTKLLKVPVSRKPADKGRSQTQTQPGQLACPGGPGRWTVRLPRWRI